MTKGVYALLIENHKEQPLQIGKLGTFVLPQGLYVYIGSALGGSATSLERRLPRHLSKTKKIFWHIDFFLQAKSVEIKAIVYAVTSEKKECLLASTVSQIKNAQSVIPGFGSSDCACMSHLPFFISEKDNLLELIKLSFMKIGLEPQIWPITTLPGE